MLAQENEPVSPAIQIKGVFPQMDTPTMNFLQDSARIGSGPKWIAAAE
jgi:hypothetical protein